MFGVILSAVSSLFSEVSSALGKSKVIAREEGLYSMAFLSYFWGFVWFGAIIIYKQQFIFSLNSLPTFIARAILDVASR